VRLETLARIGGVMCDEHREARRAASPLLKRMVTIGWTGRQSGRGLYDCSAEPPAPGEIR